MTKSSAFLVGLLIVMGAGWGATMPLAKVAVSEGYRNFGIIFWQMAIGAVFLGALLALRGKLPRFNFRQFVFCIYIALVGTILANGASYQAAVHLPAGIMSIVIAAVPMIAFPIALALRLDRFRWLRLGGLIAGMLGVVILASPESLPDQKLSIWILVALIAPTLYAVEGNSVAKLGTYGLDAVQVLFGASLFGAVLTTPIALWSGTWISPPANWNAPEYAILFGSLIHASVYASYVWMVGRAGPVFAAQVAYLVTGFGVLWSMVFLGETYTNGVWLALGLMLFGMFLVQPRNNQSLVVKD